MSKKSSSVLKNRKTLHTAKIFNNNFDKINSVKTVLFFLLLIFQTIALSQKHDFQTFSLEKDYIGEEILFNKIKPEHEVGKTKVNYLKSKQEREAYIVRVKNNLIHQNKKIYSTSVKKGRIGISITPDIYIIDTHMNFYISKDSSPNKFHHSSFISGQDVFAAGEVIVIDGKIASINKFSGHYLPSDESYKAIKHYFNKHNYTNHSIDFKLFKEAYLKGVKYMPSVIKYLKHRSDPLIPIHRCNHFL